MFETSVVRAHTQAAPARFRLLTASVIAHSAVVLGTVAISIASADFPVVAPDEYSRAPVFMPVHIPPPLGRPDGGAQKKAQAAPVKPLPAPTQPTAPSTVPETIPQAEPSTSGTTESSAVGPGTEVGPVGVPWGEKDSIGDLDAPPVPVDVPVAQPEEKIYEAHEVKAPVLITRVDPRYPASMMKAGPPATVVVRCVIDRSGSVRDPQVIVPAQFPPFNTEVLKVITQWKYRPATYAGRPVDSYQNLTVHFSVRR
jgi:periplasmic protein TonB